ncbi:MAG: hypothetical protein ACTHJW_06910 [Streptosporangiaceae bacterium]
MVAASARLAQPGLEAGAGPIDDIVSGCLAGGEFVEPGEACLGQPDPGQGFFVRSAARAGDSGEPGERFKGEALHDEGDHDDRRGDDEDEVAPGRGSSVGSGERDRKGARERHHAAGAGPGDHR